MPLFFIDLICEIIHLICLSQRTFDRVVPAGFEPATQRIQTQFQFGISFIIINSAAVNLVQFVDPPSHANVLYLNLGANKYFLTNMRKGHGLASARN